MFCTMACHCRIKKSNYKYLKIQSAIDSKSKQTYSTTMSVSLLPIQAKKNIWQSTVIKENEKMMKFSFQPVNMTKKPIVQMTVVLLI